MGQRKRTLQSKLFWVLSASIVIIILLFILVNTFVYKPFYIYSKQMSLVSISQQINKYYLDEFDIESIMLNLEKLAAQNGIEIVLKNESNELIFSSNKDFLNNIPLQENKSKSIFNFNDKVSEVRDLKTAIRYLGLNSVLDNGYNLSLRLAISPIEQSVKISNTFLTIIGTIIIAISGVIILAVSKRFMEPIAELECIAKKMANLDFSVKYKVKSENDELNNLGKSMNLMSMQLEKTIRKLQTTNLELEKDIEQKSKIDEMRKQFISDVSHELKTPIALIQGYAEGLQENINTDEESRKFYTEVILDEANKMDNLVKNLLELMKLEYCKREFHNARFDIVELIKEVIRKSKVLLENINIEFDDSKPYFVFADAFYIEQVITNYVTNAIKNVDEVNGEKLIKILLEKDLKNDRTRITVFNTGKNIPIEDMNRIWNRFYKRDSSRNRDQGGTGIGLAFVKAIMNNYDNQYGVLNKENGVGFYIEL